MSVVRPASGRLLRRFSTALTSPAILYNAFHTSIPRPGRKRQRFSNVKAVELGLTTPEKVEEYAKQVFPDYTEAEKAALKQRYTPEQYAAIEAGEAAINPQDLTLQGRLRDDMYRPQYLEDYATVDPIVDWRPQEKIEPQEVKWLEEKDWLDELVGMDANMKTMEKSLNKSFARALRKVKEGKEGQAMIDFTEDELKDFEEDPEKLENYMANLSTKDKQLAPGENEAEPNKAAHVVSPETWKQISEAFMKDFEKEYLAGNKGELPGPKFDPEVGSALSPNLGKIPGVAGLYSHESSKEDEILDPAGEYQHVKKVTGMKIKDIMAVPTKILVRRFVSNQTRLGKIRSLSIMTVAGNGDGRLGVGMAKSTEPEVALLTSKLLAIRNMKPIRRYENRTIYGTVKAKVSGTVVELRSRPPGFGLRVSHRIFEMCRMAGIHDLSAVIPRSRNPMNTVKACYEALLNQPDPEEIAIGRGKKLVDARKVYYGGSVY